MDGKPLHTKPKSATDQPADLNPEALLPSLKSRRFDSGFCFKVIQHKIVMLCACAPFVG
jgi:hypothetical protein